MKLQFNMKFFYVGGAVCFSIVALMNALSLFLNPQTLTSAISAVAYLIFECLLVWFFIYSYNSTFGKNAFQATAKEELEKIFNQNGRTKAE
jgi:hypothetical protein